MFQVNRLTLPALPRTLLMGLLPLGLVMSIALGLAASVWVGCHAPAEALLAEREVAFQTAKQHHARLQNTRKQQEILKAAQKQVEGQQLRLPTQNDFSSLSMSISELGQAEHVTIPGMTYSVQKKENGMPVKATMTFKATGDYASIYKFIQRLEQTEPYLVIESLDAARVDHTEQVARALVVFNMKVVTFLRASDDLEQKT